MWVFNMSISIMFCTVFCIIILFGTISLAAILLCTTCLIGSHHLHPGFLNSNIWLEIVSQRKGDFCFSFQGNYVEREYLPEMCKGWDSDTSKSGKSTIVWWGGEVKGNTIRYGLRKNTLQHNWLRKIRFPYWTVLFQYWGIGIDAFL